MPITAFPPYLTPSDLEGALLLLAYVESKKLEPEKTVWYYFMYLKQAAEGENVYLA